MDDMNATRYKPGSRVQACWELYQKSGAEACLGAAVAMNLALSTVRSWVRGWDKENGKAPERATAPAGPIVMHTKKLITVRYVKDKDKSKAYLGDQGPQVSVVRFAHDGSEQCISNEYLGLPVDRQERNTIERA
jgi:hypothetical protein